jgi:2'-5' RNA ligase
MSTPAAKDILAYWLIPAEPALSYFQSLIRDLSSQFDAAQFEPHLTLYVTEVGKDDPASVLEKALAGFQPLRLAVTGIDYSAEFTKTLFVQFRPDETLPKLSAKLRSTSVLQCEYQLNPHLSLIYKTMSPETKMQIANSLCLPFTEVEFDSVKAVVSPAKIETSEDVNSWRVVATRRLPE